jgi:uncharacterized protein YegL
MRRLPVYLLLDCSESMAGPGIDELQQGVARLIQELEGDPQALETAWLSIIAFSGKAEVVVPLTELSSLQVPKLKVRTGTSLGGALRLLCQSIKSDLKRTTSETKGDLRPLVFLFSDGQPTDSWENACAELKLLDGMKIANFYAFGCGIDADLAVLNRITDIVFNMKDLSHDVWQKLFVWLSASVSAASIAVGAENEDGIPIKLPADLEKKLERVSAQEAESAPRSTVPNQLFLHALCSRERKPYLMRFIKHPERAIYGAAASHPLEEAEEGAESLLPPVNAKDLYGVPPCPYCEAPGAGACSCGTLICIDPKNEEALDAHCPKCGAMGRFGAGGSDLSINQVQG